MSLMKWSKKSKVPDFAPGDISEDTARVYFERGAHISIEKNRWFFICAVLSFALIIESVALVSLFPLKTVQTFMLSKQSGGRVVVDTTPVGQWEPDNDSLTYFLSQWANAVFDVNRATIDKMIIDASEVTVSNASAQLREFRMQDNPLVNLNKIPNYTRSYVFKSINFVKKDVALIRFKTVTRSNEDTTEQTYLMTVNFVLIRPKTIEQVIKNPAGLYITNFTVSKEAIND